MDFKSENQNGKIKIFTQDYTSKVEIGEVVSTEKNKLVILSGNGIKWKISYNLIK